MINKKLLLLDMNSTFMFGEDRFGEAEDFSIHYHQLGGILQRDEINTLIRTVYCYLDCRYPDLIYQEIFPSVAMAIAEVSPFHLPEDDVSKIIDTFAFHEMGYIPEEYLQTLFSLYEKFQLALVIDIWAPKSAWLFLFKKYGIDVLFSAISFSSDHGIVKPSPIPFEMLISKLNIKKQHSLVIGDSIRRDLGGAQAAGIDCVLVGGATDERAVAHFDNLTAFCHAI